MAPAGTESLMTRLEKLARPLFLLSLVGEFVGLAFIVGGLASLQAYCTSNDGIVPGVRPAFQTGAAMQANLSGFKCSRYWRFEWWGFALQICFAILLWVMYHLRRIYKYRAAIFSAGATITVLNMYFCNELLTQYYQTEGTLRTRGIMTFLGFALCAGTNYITSFAACALIEMRQHPDAGALDDRPGSFFGGPVTKTMGDPASRV